MTDNYLVPEDHPLYAQYQAAVLNAVFAAYIDPVPYLIGYDPQKLLAPPDIYRSLAERCREAMTLDYDTMASRYERTLGKGLVLGEPYFGEPYWWDDRPEPEPEVPWPHKLAVLDFRHAEIRVLSALVGRRDVRAILIDIDSPGGEIVDESFVFKTGSACGKTDRQLRLYALGMMLAAKPAAPPKRQPGYLKHDPTKRQRRWRPK